VACLLLVALMLLFQSGRAQAHPGASIDVAKDGRVYFVDTGGGLFVLGLDGKLTRLEGPAFHWFALDESSRLAKTRWPSIPGAEIVAAGRDPTLVLSSDFALTVGSDGALYYPDLEEGRHSRIVRVDPSGSRSVRASPPFKSRPDGSTSSINGLAAGADGSLYFTHDRSVQKIDARGRITTIVDNVRVANCARIPGVDRPTGPYLRGIDIAPNGTLFVASAGCGAVLMISVSGNVRPVLRAVSPYSPTAVAVSGGEIFVLEYLHTDSDNREEWLPRIRKVSRTGKVVTLVTGTR